MSEDAISRIVAAVIARADDVKVSREGVVTVEFTHKVGGAELKVAVPLPRLVASVRAALGSTEERGG